jgi:hypothetical protein
MSKLHATHGSILNAEGESEDDIKNARERKREFVQSIILISTNL